MNTENTHKKPKINALVIAGLIINVLVALSFSINPDLGDIAKPVMLFMLVSWAVSVIGAVMVATTGKKAGAILIIIGCVLFVPIGLIGVFGAKKILEEINRIEADV